MMEFFCINLS